MQLENQFDIQLISPIIKMQTVHISVRVVAKMFDCAVNYAF